MSQYKLIISGGGTGGHIFPAIAIANAFKQRHPNCEILFVGAKGKMEMQKVPEAGYPIKGLWISGIQRKLTIDNLSFPFKVVSSLLKARKIIKSFRPDIAIGVGGFASGPLLKAASMMGIPTLIQEQNSYPGITNKLLAAKASRICVAYEGLERWFPKDKIVITGNPLRKEMVDISGKKERALNHFGLKPEKACILAVGGSLGALSINKAIAKSIEIFDQKDYQLIWQTGKNFESEANEILSENKINNISQHTFIKEMDLAYAAADIIISRAGAMAISELSVIAKPCLLVPYPYASEDHQTANAKSLSEKNAAILIKDNEASDSLMSSAIELLEDNTKRVSMSNNLKGFSRANATDLIIDEIEKLISKK